MFFYELMDDFAMGDIMQSVMQMYGVMLIYLLALIIFKVLFMLAIGFDCKARGDNKQSMWMILCFFFPLPAGIVYGCTRNKNNQAYNKFCPNCGAVLHPAANFCPNCNNMNLVINEPKDSAKNTKTSKTLFGVSVAFYVCAVIAYVVFIMSVVSMTIGTVDSVLDNSMNALEEKYNDDTHYGYIVDDKIVYYDREGNVYFDDDDVLYYDKNGATYTYDDDDYSFEGETGVRYDYAYCFVDSDGYFIYDAEGYQNDYNAAITFNERTGDYCDKDGNIYYYADEVSWDSEGTMVDCYLGHPLVDAD